MVIPKHLLCYFPSQKASVVIHCLQGKIQTQYHDIIIFNSTKSFGCKEFYLKFLLSQQKRGSFIKTILEKLWNGKNWTTKCPEEPEPGMLWGCRQQKFENLNQGYNSYLSTVYGSPSLCGIAINMTQLKGSQPLCPLLLVLKSPLKVFWLAQYGYVS